MANEDQKAAITTERGKQASKIADSDERKSYIAGSANVDKDYEGTASETERKGNSQLRAEVLGDYQLPRDARK
jgi:hypothetical protein